MGYFDNSALMSEDVNLLCERNAMLRVLHKVKEINDPPWFASLATRSVAGTVGGDDTIIPLNKQIYLRKSWHQLHKNRKKKEITTPPCL